LDPGRWERIQEIFFVASDLKSSERAEYLDRACAEEMDLRTEVERVLRSLDDGVDPVRETIQSEVAVALEHSPGDRIGPYRLVRKLGQGGMGSVYLAERDDRQFQRQVAIKLIRPEAAASPDLLRRFRAERQILADLDHPYIAHLLSGGVTEQGIPYLVLEHIDGRPINEYCREHALEIPERIRLFQTVCAAVAYAHRNLVVHRDIKPSNILVTADGIPKLLDFGIAKLLKPEQAAMTVAMTRPAERLMTLEYASPEQVRGGAITTATDVYALGVVLYELVAGVAPLDLANMDQLEAQRSICEVMPVPPSRAERAGRKVRAAADLDNIVMMALRKSPDERYASVEQLSEDLRHYVEGFPVLASKGNRRYRAAKFIARHRTGVAIAAVGTLLVAGFIVGMSVLAARLARERTRAERVSQFLTGLFSSSDPYLNQRANLTAKQLLDGGSKRILHDLQNEPAVRADLLQTMAQAYQHLGLKSEAEAAFRQQAGAAAQAYGADSIQVSVALRQLGDVERQRSELSQSEVDLRRALAIQEKHQKPTDREIAHTLNNLGLVLQTRGDVAGAEPLFRRAVEISRLYPDQASQTLVMMSNLGSVLVDRGNYAEAERVLRETLARRKEMLGANHPQVALSMNRLAHFLVRKGAWKEAESLYRDSLLRYQAAYPPSHPELLATKNNLAVLLQETGRFDEAEALYRSVIDTGTRALDDVGAANVALWSGNLASLLAERLEFREADALFESAFAMCRARLGADSTREARLLSQRGVTLAFRGRNEAAKLDFDTALAIRRKRLGENHPDVAASLFDLGRFQEALDMDSRTLPADHPQTATHEMALAEQLGSEPLARAALRIRERVLPAGAWQIDDAKVRLAAILSRAGNCRDAEPLAVQAEAIRNKLGERTMTAQSSDARLAEVRHHCTIH
jgi:serine/threonine-protein kinase